MPYDIEDHLTQSTTLTQTAKPMFPPVTPSPKRQIAADTRELQSAGDIHILILDDDPHTCAVIQAALSNRDFAVDVVSDPMLVESALAGPTSYHLIVLDYVLPGLDTEQVFGWIRDRQPDANIIVVTGYPSVDSAINCLRAKTCDYLTKPFQVEQLREIVYRCLESKGLLRMTEDALKEALGRRDSRTPQGAGLDAGQYERPHRCLARLPQPDRARQEFRFYRNALSHLSGTGNENE